jgi:cyclohexadieny/prephenate dehydrogenase
MKIDRLAVIGIGLLGGSVARAARPFARYIVGWDQAADVGLSACQTGILDENAPGLLEAVRGADVVVFCTPVDRIAEQVLAVASVCKPGALLTDVGSTKLDIVRATDGRVPAFVASHPLAGSEKMGFEHGRADLFDGRLVFVTPGRSTERGALSRVCAFWGEMGALVEVIEAEEHDRALALTSHLPHLVASALAGVLPAEWRRLTGTGFQDTTRLASGCPKLWTAIFRSNRVALLAALERMSGQLEEFRAALSAEDTDRINELLRLGKIARDGLPPLSARG